MSGGGNNKNSVGQLVSLYTFFSGTKLDRLLISAVIVMIGLSWMSKNLYLAQIAGTFTFALFVKYFIFVQMPENAREFERTHPNFDHDAEVFTKGTFFMGLFVFLFGLPFTIIGINTTSALFFSLGELPPGVENVDLFIVIGTFWQPFGCLLFFSVGLGIQYMGLYSCWRYLVQ